MSDTRTRAEEAREAYQEWDVLWSEKPIREVDAAYITALEAELHHADAEVGALSAAFVAVRKRVAALEAEIKELREHERQTHIRLGRVLGNDDSLEQGAKRLLKRAEAEAALAAKERENAELRKQAESALAAEREELYKAKRKLKELAASSQRALRSDNETMAELSALVRPLESALAAERERADKAEAERDKWRWVAETACRARCVYAGGPEAEEYLAILIDSYAADHPEARR